MVEEPEDGGVDHDARHADQAEHDGTDRLPQPLGGRRGALAELAREDVPAQPREVPGEGEALAQVGLGPARGARREAVTDFRDAQPGVADEDLEQQLEAGRAQPVEVDGVAAEGEQAAHRVGHGGEAAGEDDPAEPACRARHHRAAAAVEALPRPGAGVPGADHDVRVVPQGGACEAGGVRGRVLEVGVHDEDPLARRVPGTGDDGGREAAAAPAGLAVQQAHRHLAAGRLAREDGGSGVVAVVDHEDLGVQAGEQRAELAEERPDVLLLVARRDDHGEAGGGAGRRRQDAHGRVGRHLVEAQVGCGRGRVGCEPGTAVGGLRHRCGPPAGSDGPVSDGAVSGCL